MKAFSIVAMLLCIAVIVLAGVNVVWSEDFNLASYDATGFIVLNLLIIIIGLVLLAYSISATVSFFKSSRGK